MSTIKNRMYSLVIETTEAIERGEKVVGNGHHLAQHLCYMAELSACSDQQWQVWQAIGGGSKTVRELMQSIPRMSRNSLGVVLHQLKDKALARSISTGGRSRSW